jgi:integrase
MALTTDRQIAALKPAEARYDTAIGGAKGLLIRVYPNGTKVWQLRFVAPNGDRKRLLLGNYPGLSLADAREAANAHRVSIANGNDPAAERAAKIEAARTGETMADLWEAYRKAAAKGLHGGRGRPKRASTMAVEKNRWDKHIAPVLGKKRFAEMRRADVRKFMHDLATAGELSADSIASIGTTISSLFAYAVHVERIESNPALGLTRPLATQSRDRRFGDPALALILAALRDARARQVRKAAPATENGPLPATSRVERIVAAALEFALLTLCRRTEAAEARWEEIDVSNKVWTIPAARAKGGRPHIVPLSDSVIALLDWAKPPQADAKSNPFVFSSPSDPEKPIDARGLTRALKRLCSAMKLPEGSPHDFRRSGATTLTGERYGIRRFIVSRVLAHAATDGAAAVTGVYDRNDYLPEKRQALDTWARHLEGLLAGGAGGSNVVPLRGAAA